MIKKTFNRLGLLSVFMCVLTACNKQNDATTTEVLHLHLPQRHIQAYPFIA